jgi:hypothetical protein
MSERIFAPVVFVMDFFSSLTEYSPRLFSVGRLAEVAFTALVSVGIEAPVWLAH